MTSISKNPLLRLTELGQSPWLDYIRRSLVTGGELRKLIDKDGVKGVTSNPAIFEKAISGSTDYDDWLDEWRTEDLEPSELFERLAIRDIRAAADVLNRTYEETDGGDGFVSLEVSPYLANDTEKTIEEARRLWKAVDRDNLMIKVPGTEAGLSAIETLTADGVNVNVTLLFSRAVYERVVQAYSTGLEKRAQNGEDVSRVSSVASFFVSRIDAAIENEVDERLESTTDETTRGDLRGVRGKVAIANAKLAYRSFQELFSGERWAALEKKGAKKQRLLWASTGTKNPAYSDVLYVEELIGPETVTTLPVPTLNAFRDHGRAEARLETDLSGAEATLRRLDELDISLERITGDLVEDGVRKFAQAFDKLLQTLDRRCLEDARVPADRSTFTLPADLTGRLDASLEDWSRRGKMKRLWEGDAELWTDDGESAWLGWLGLTGESEERSDAYRKLSSWVRRCGFEDAVVLGMGGSSLCPDVLATTFGKIDGFPRLRVLDSTDPEQIRALDEALDLSKTLFIVSSKSGTTLEPNLFEQYFYNRVQEEIGSDAPGRFIELTAPGRFIAVTDPGSPLEELARNEGFARVFHGVVSVGGRYSALSSFGMVPGAAMGLDVVDFLERADTMPVATSSCVPVASNPGTRLGIALGEAAKQGRDKLTLIVSPAIASFGAWLEQLVAESTGKNGKAIIPVDGETIGPADVYGEDRLFVYVRLDGAPDSKQDLAVAKLDASGQPVLRIPVADRRDLGQEFFRWEMATAVAGAILGINPFDQPDVEASKTATRKLTEEFETSGRLPEESSIFEEDGIKLFTDANNAAELGEQKSLKDFLRAHFGRLEPGDYAALLAYVAMNEAYRASLQRMRHAVRDRKRVATCLGFGPRFLHSTGQAYKGGPNTGVFLQITAEPREDLPVPGRSYTFGIVQAAQARGDFEVLAERGRRALRVHLGANVADSLERLHAAVRDALS